MLPRQVASIRPGAGSQQPEAAIAERRRVMDQGAHPVAEGVAVALADLAIGRSEWVRLLGVQAAGEAILYLHGSGFSKGSPASHRSLVSAIVASSGTPALVVDYRLAPEHRFPAALEDALSAYRHLAGIVPPDRIVVVGDSAGGGLTLALLLVLKDAGLPMPAGAVTLSAWTDLTVSGEVPADADDPVVRLEMLRRAADLYLDGADARDPYVSPLFGNLEGLPPILMQAGTREIMRVDSLSFAERARAAGVIIDVELYEGMAHVFQLNTPSADATPPAIERIADFIQKQVMRHDRDLAPE